MRDAGREIERCRTSLSTTSEAIAAQLSGGATGPATAAARAEVTLRLRQALARMNAIDFEVLALRHFEQLSNGETAVVIGIEERAVAKRYVRALKRLKQLLADMPGGLSGLGP
jgi:RNA polymerase sigma-70 factor (ECF subfamily)